MHVQMINAYASPLQSDPPPMTQYKSKILHPALRAKITQDILSMTTPSPLLNLTNILALHNFIASHPPSSCRMSDIEAETSCGTAYCIFGFAKLLWRDEYDSWLESLVAAGESCISMNWFAGMLGIKRSVAHDLFSGGRMSITKFDALPPQTRKNVMLGTLELLAETGEERFLEALEQYVDHDTYMVITERRGVDTESFIL